MSTNLNEVLETIYSSDIPNIHIYLDCVENDNEIIPRMYTYDEIKKIKKHTGLDNGEKFLQIEKYFRDMIKIDVNIPTIMKHSLYIKKKTTYNVIGNILILKNEINQIEKQNFPILSNYHNIETKNIELFEMKTIDLLIIERSDKQYQICLSIRDKSQKNKKQLLSELKQII
jgi:hypothetical protein